jgi:hypothetical protein
MLTWAVGGIVKWNGISAALIQYNGIVYMDVAGAMGIGAGALAGAAEAVFLFRDTDAGPNSKKTWRGPGELS